MGRVLWTVAGVILLSGRGIADKPNQAFCAEFIADLERCGDFDLSTIYPEDFCDSFQACDYDELERYFACMAENDDCDEETDTYTPAEGCELPTCEEVTGCRSSR